MGNDFLRLPLLFITLCVLQVFVFNHVHLFGCVMPLCYVYFVLAMRKGMPKWLMLTLAFALGLTLDIFTNTPGVTSAAMTLAAMAQPYLLELFISREGEDNFIPSMSTLGTKPFVNFTLVLVGGYCTVFFSLEMFNFFNMLKWLECVAGSTILTVALILAADRLFYKKV